MKGNFTSWNASATFLGERSLQEPKNLCHPVLKMKKRGEKRDKWAFEGYTVEIYCNDRAFQPPSLGINRSLDCAKGWRVSLRTFVVSSASWRAEGLFNIEFLCRLGGFRSVDVITMAFPTFLLWCHWYVIGRKSESVIRNRPSTRKVERRARESSFTPTYISATLILYQSRATTEACWYLVPNKSFSDDLSWTGIIMNVMVLLSSYADIIST